MRPIDPLIAAMVLVVAVGLVDDSALVPAAVVLGALSVGLAWWHARH